MEIGQQVMCVAHPSSKNDTYRKYPGYELTIGRIYTIRDIDTRSVPTYGVPTIRLEEIIGPIQNLPSGPWEIGYHPRRFRPLKRTDISQFTRMVKDLDKIKNAVIAAESL